MGTDIGYLQIKIRKIQEQFDVLNEKVENSLKIEKRFVNKVENIFKELRDSEIKFSKVFIRDLLEQEYTKNLRNLFKEAHHNMAHQVDLQKKGFNESAKSLLKEVALLKKDNDFLLNLFKSKLNISKEDMIKECKYFDKNYPQKRVEEYVNSFKMVRMKESEFQKRVDERK